MKEPLLPAVVSNEPEPSISNQSFDRPVRHVDNLRGSLLVDPMGLESNFQAVVVSGFSRTLTEPLAPALPEKGQLAGSRVELKNLIRHGLGEDRIGGEHQHR